jgi:hypothetical protein
MTPTSTRRRDVASHARASLARTIVVAQRAAAAD